MSGFEPGPAGPQPPAGFMIPQNPDALQAETLLGVRQNAPKREISSGSWIAASLPFFAALVALFLGMTVEETANSGWDGSATMVALLATVGIGVAVGGPLLAMFHAWGGISKRLGRFLVFIGITFFYLVGAAAAFVLGFAVALTRDPPEC